MTRITEKLHRYIFNFPIIKSQLFWLNPFNKAENLHFSYILIEFKCLIVQNFIDPTISSFSCSCYNCIVTMLSIIHNLLSNLTSVIDFKSQGCWLLLSNDLQIALAQFAAKFEVTGRRLRVLRSQEQTDWYSICIDADFVLLCCVECEGKDVLVSLQSYMSQVVTQKMRLWIQVAKIKSSKRGLASPLEILRGIWAFGRGSEQSCYFFSKLKEPVGVVQALNQDASWPFQACPTTTQYHSKMCNDIPVHRVHFTLCRCKS